MALPAFAAAVGGLGALLSSFGAALVAYVAKGAVAVVLVRAFLFAAIVVSSEFVLSLAGHNSLYGALFQWIAAPQSHVTAVREGLFGVPAIISFGNYFLWLTGILDAFRYFISAVIAIFFVRLLTPVR